jgi:hypothetical protein
LSGQKTNDRDIDEPTTDLAIFICGFGGIFLAGQSGLQLASDGWKQVHYGYLTPEQYRFTHRWVMAARGITLPTRFRPGLFSRLLSFKRPSGRKSERDLQTELLLLDEAEILRKRH